MSFWIFRGNREDFDIDTYLKDYKSIYWAVRHPKHQYEMQLGDKVFIWRSKGKSKDPYGVVALGEICELPKHKSLVTHPEFLVDRLWKTKEVSSVKVGLTLKSVRLSLDEGMIEHEFFLGNPILSGMQLIKARQGTNFYLSPEQFNAVLSLWNGESEDEDVAEYSALEDKTKLILHKKRERNRTLVKKAKEDFLKKNGSIFCEACGISFKKIYGFDYIEVHHKKPLSEIKSGEITKLSDLVLLCANCHRAVHRIKDSDPFNILKEIFL
ncbi:MAG: HNH endonuclease [Anaerolineaceae bacterium]